ncbi:MAG: dihydrofolate reductase [Chloroflexi bacterium]|nr:dihydrofolate reductase [Chloroflexota bacterium]
MRNIIVTEFMSLDGVVENPGWTFPYWNDETAAFKTEESSSGEHLLLGRVTYQQFASAWPNSTDQGAAYFNGTRKYVFSNAPVALDWNNSVQLKGDLVEAVTQLKQQDGPELVVHGSIALANGLLQAGLVDRLRLLIYPVVIGTGKRLFQDDARLTLKLIESKAFSSGVIACVYQPEHS